jgi:RHS repeat-associated protein
MKGNHAGKLALVFCQDGLYNRTRILAFQNARAERWELSASICEPRTSPYGETRQPPANTEAPTYAYNGLGDRLQATVNGMTTTFTLDLATGLTQVLGDGTNTYLYGASRIAQENSAGREYFLGDALGSVRQMADAGGEVVHAAFYSPYGEVLSTAGAAQTGYGYTGEQQDASGRVYLRARVYDPGVGRFVTRDTWGGNDKQSMSYNMWLYTFGNPVNITDPSGNDPYWCENEIDPDTRQQCYDNWKISDGGRKLPPSVTGYSNKVQPHNISWISNPFADKIANGNVPGMPGNQLQIPGHSAYYECTSTHDIAYSMNSLGKCPGGKWISRNTSFCGDAAVAAILALAYNNITARKIVEQWGHGDNKSTYANDVSNFINKNYGDGFSAEEVKLESFFNDSSTFTGFGGWIKNELVSNHIIMAVAESDMWGELIYEQPYTGHWVIITGISEWVRDTRTVLETPLTTSSWNWIRIFNPFGGQTEYYWWGHFFQSWKWERAAVRVIPNGKMFNK